MVDSDIVAYTVTDSLDLAYGGDGVDTLINIERIEFADRVYNLKIRDISSDWDNYKTVVGTDGDDLTFIDFTDDKTDDTAATDSYSQTTWQLKGGAGNDVIVGGFEKKFANEWMEGDSAIFGADSKYFDVSIEQVAFTDATIDWDNDGTIDDADTTLKDALKARFDGTEIARIVVEDTRDAAGGGLGTDVLYGIENLQFGASSDGQGYDWNQRFKVEAEINDWDR